MNIIITGASRGIGKAIALELASKGYNLALCARNIDELKALEKFLTKKFSGNVFIKACDCSIKSEIQEFVEFAKDKFGVIDVLVNNVGVFKPASILEESDDNFLSQFQLNVLSAYHFYKFLGVHFKLNRFGFIFNICSVASLNAIFSAGSYSVTKAALLSLNNVMREELKNFGVKVTAIIPGETYTSSWEGTVIPENKFVDSSAIAKTIATALSFNEATYFEQIIIKPLKF